MEIIKDSPVEAWKTALSFILENGRDFEDQEKRMCRQIINLMLTIKKPSKGIEEPITTMRAFDRWVYPSKEELKNTLFYEKAGIGYDYSYGSRIFNYNNVKDQVNDYVVPILQKNIGSRRGSIIIYEPIKDSDVNNKNTPGLISIHVIVKDKKLRLTGIVRSNDIFVGWPANIFQLHLLQQEISKKLNLEAGELTTVSLSAHIFEEHFTEIRKVIGN
jgi:thymidylate synthase